MPARHDILVGALDFPWRPWGSIEVWEDAVTRSLRRNGVTTMLVSDHPHLFETGGENYHTDFTAWAYERGHENDPWRTTPDPTWTGTPALPVERPAVPPRLRRLPDLVPGRGGLPRSADHAGGGRVDRHLGARATTGSSCLVDEFDPHEPFDTPEPCASLLQRGLGGGRLAIWPPYLVGALAGGLLDPGRARHIRNNYGAKLTMIDHWFGRLLEAVDEAGLAGSTGGRGLHRPRALPRASTTCSASPAAPVYSELGRIPLLVRWPGPARRDVDALTTSVDLHATIADVFGAEVGHPTHGRRCCRSSRARRTSVRELALFGYWGRHVGVTDGRRRYLRGCGDGNLPLSMWSNRWSTMPVHPLPELRLPRPDDRAELRDHAGHRRSRSSRQPFGPGDALPFWALGPPPSETLLFDTTIDPDELEDRSGGREESELVDGLAAALHAIEAPGDRWPAWASPDAHRRYGPAQPTRWATAANLSCTERSRSRRSFRATR